MGPRTAPTALLCAILLIVSSSCEVADAKPLCEEGDGDLPGGYSPVSVPLEDGTTPLGLDEAYEALAEHLALIIPASIFAEACPDGTAPKLSSLETDTAEVCNQVVAGTNYRVRLPLQMTCEGAGSTLPAKVAATVFVPLPSSNASPQVGEMFLEAVPDTTGNGGTGASASQSSDDSGAVRLAFSLFLLVAATLSMVSTLF